MNSFENHTFNNGSMGHMLLEEVRDDVYHLLKIFGLLYTFSCLFFLLYIIRDTTLQLKKKKIISRTANDQHIYLVNEQLIRNVINLIFLFFETTFSIFGILYGIYFLSLSLLSDHGHFDRKTGYTLFIIITLSNLISFSFSMMLCLFGVSILHLSYAARNELNVRSLIKFILIGFFVNLVIIIALYISRGSIFVKLIQITLYHIILIVILCIAKRKLFPAMNSRIIDAYHLHNPESYLKQKSYLKRYKKLIPFILITFELYVIKDVLLFLKYAISYFIHSYPNPFNLNDIPHKLSSHDYILYNIECYLLVLMPILDSIVFFNLTLVNFAYISSIVFNIFKSLCFTKTFRYQIYSSQSDGAMDKLKEGLLPGTKGVANPAKPALQRPCSRIKSACFPIIPGLRS